MSKTVKALLTACALAATAGATSAQEQVVNLYSGRHYSTDEALYTGFTKATGIKINRVDADDAGILARLKAEGSASPADVILLVDAARLYKGEVDGLFQPIQSKVLNDAIPANLRSAPAADGGISWFGCPPAPASSSTTRSRSKKPMWTRMKSWETPRTRASSAFARVRTPTT